jgi:ZIP family zinc transporter
MSILVLALAASTFVSTLLGGIAALRLRDRLHPVMAFAAGVLVATALVDLLPEAAEMVGPDPALPVGVVALAGFLIFSALDAFLHRQAFAHGGHDHGHGHAHAETEDSALGIVGPAGLVVHSALDGLAIGIGFQASNEIGLLVAFAVLAHDFADGMNVVTLSLAGGGSRRGAIAFLVLDALAPVVGALAGSFADVSGPVLGQLLALFAGVFIAIGAGHLLPEAEQHRPGVAPALVGLAAAGAVVVVVVRTLLG